jgi:hypothetical protein
MNIKIIILNYKNLIVLKKNHKIKSKKFNNRFFCQFKEIKKKKFQ